MMNKDFSESLTDNLRQIIKEQHISLLATINIELIGLFWTIGNEINQFVENINNSSEIESELTKEFSSHFMPVFGEYFNIQNLDLMRAFANKYSLKTVGRFAAAINWKFVPYLMKVEDESAFMFYVQLVHVKSLTPDELNSEIVSGAFEKGGIIAENSFLRAFSAPFYLSSIELYFGKEGVNSFRKLFEPKNEHAETIDSFFSKKGINFKFYQKVFQLITDGQSYAQYLLNLQFNTLLWEIGNEISIYLKRYGSKVEVSLIEYCIQELGKEFSSIFNNSDLPYCIKFAQLYTNLDDQQVMSETVRWEYIKTILDVESVKKQLFIANEVLSNGIAVPDLKELILNGCFDFMANSSLILKSSKVTAPNQKENRDGNVIVQLTEEIMEPKIVPKSDLNRNIFKNDTFLQFIEGNSIYKT